MRSLTGALTPPVALSLLMSLLWGDRPLYANERSVTAHSAKTATTRSPAHERSTRQAPASHAVTFELNKGQTDREVRFLSRGGRYNLFFTDAHAVLTLADETGGRSSRAALRVELVGARRSRSVKGIDPLPGRSHYFVGGDPDKWRTDVPTYAKVRYAHVYPGVDLVYYGNQERQLEYDFVVAAGADARAIRLRFDGADAVRVEDNGDLLVSVGGHALRQRKPVVYQDVAGSRHEIVGAYLVDARGDVTFQLGRYDRRHPVIIDPVLLFSTYLGGTNDRIIGAEAIAVDLLGNVYVAGSATAIDFPVTAGAFQTENQGIDEAFVTKFNRTGSIVYSTFLGGRGSDEANGLAVDGFGHAFVVGATASPDFPATSGALGPSCEPFAPEVCNVKAFVTKLNPSGTALVYSTFLGGDAERAIAVAQGIAIDRAGNAFIGGSAGPGFPVTPGAFQTTYGGGGLDVFVAKLNAAGSALHYSTYIGGSHWEITADIAIDKLGAVYLTGKTTSPAPSFPISPGAFQNDCPVVTFFNDGRCDIVYVAKLSAAGSSLVYSTYLGGFGESISALQGISSEAGGIAVDSYGHAYVTGYALTTDFPTTPGSLKDITTTRDAFVTKLSIDGTGLEYSTYLGGDVGGFGGFEEGYDIQVDAAGNAYVIGSTESLDFPIAGSAVQPEYGGGIRDVFVAKVNAAGNGLIYSTYLGGSSIEDGNQISVDAFGTAYVFGRTESTDFPTVNAAQLTPSTKFVAKLGDLLPFVNVTANGVDGPLVLSPGDPLDVHLAFDAGSGGVLDPGEVYIGIIAPSGLFWLDLPTLTFVPTPTVTFSGPVPSFGPSRLFHIANSSVLPAGTYIPFMVIDNDSNEVLNGTFVDWVVIEVP